MCVCISQRLAHIPDFWQLGVHQSRPPEMVMQIAGASTAHSCSHPTLPCFCLSDVNLMKLPLMLERASAQTCRFSGPGRKDCTRRAEKGDIVNLLRGGS